MKCWKKSLTIFLFQQKLLGILNLLMTILIIATYTISFFIQNYLQNRLNLNQTSPVIYNNLSIELSSDCEGENDEAKDFETIKTVVVTTFLCVICWLPFFTAIFQSEDSVDYSLKKYTFLLAAMKSSLNPLALISMNCQYRLLLGKIKFWSWFRRNFRWYFRKSWKKW